MKRIGIDKDAHDVGNVVGTQGISTESAGQNEADAGVAVLFEKVRLRFAQKAFDGQINDDGDNGREERAEKPGADDLGENADIRRIAAVKVPADNGADNGLRGRDRNA